MQSIKSSAPAEADPTGLSLADFLRRSSEALLANVDLLERSQVAISCILPPIPSEELCRDLQALDLVTQTLSELASLLERVASGTHASAGIDPELFQPVRLSDLRDRLIGARLTVDSHPPSQSPIEFW